MNTPEAWSERATLPGLSAVMWSPDGQDDRFAAVLKVFDTTNGMTVLDFGCGTGGFCRFFPPQNYLGYDWSEGMVERAKQEHPAYAFTSSLTWQHFDLVACIGTFNLPGSFKETWETLNSLWVRTESVLAVSLYQGADRSCLSYDEFDLCEFAAARAERWRIEKHRHNDLLLSMWR